MVKLSSDRRSTLLRVCTDNNALFHFVVTLYIHFILGSSFFTSFLLAFSLFVCLSYKPFFTCQVILRVFVVYVAAVKEEETFYILGPWFSSIFIH